MIRIKFDVDHKPKQGDGKGPEYRKGQSYDFSGFTAETYAKKYVRLGYAHEIGVTASTVDAAKASQAELELAEAQRKSEEAAKLAERSAVHIPDDLDGLSWNELRGLAAKLTDETVHGKRDALAAIEAERGRRAVAA